MAITNDINENGKENKVKLQNEISSLKKNITDYKEEKKLDWKSFKNKFNDDLDNFERSLREIYFP